MINVVVIFSLFYSGFNWMFFVISAFLALRIRSQEASKGFGQAEVQGLDPEKILTGAAKVAAAFKAAGAAPTAAALSLVGLIIAAISAGIAK